MEEENRILDFLSGKMTDAEKQSFLKEMEADDELKAAVNHSRIIRNMLSEDRATFSEAVMDVIHEKRAKKSKSVYWIAASLSLLLAVTIVFFWRQPSDSVLELADRYLEPHKDMLTNRADGEVQIDLSDYKNGDYELAVKSLSNQLNSQYNAVTALYLGVSYLLVDEPAKANIVFNEIDKSKIIFSDDVLWYQSLALIKMNRLEEAKSLLKLLAEQQTVYKEKSIKLMELIN
ncbi:MAG: hypothetical protein AAFQ94_10995 [Bacteroidota bacterium]